jgi:hypothetical protein
MEIPSFQCCQHWAMVFVTFALAAHAFVVMVTGHTLELQYMHASGILSRKHSSQQHCSVVVSK